MFRLLTRHQPRFTQDGLFFYALLGVVALGDRVTQFVGEPGPEGALESGSPRAAHGVSAEHGVDSVVLAFLGALSLRKRAVAMVREWAAQGRPPEPPAAVGALPSFSLLK